MLSPVLALAINLEKTLMIYQPAPGMPYTEPNTFVYNKCIDVVDDTVYFGSTLFRTFSLYSKVVRRIHKTNNAFTILEQ